MSMDRISFVEVELPCHTSIELPDPFRSLAGMSNEEVAEAITTTFSESHDLCHLDISFLGQSGVRSEALTQRPALTIQPPCNNLRIASEFAFSSAT